MLTSKKQTVNESYTDIIQQLTGLQIENAKTRENFIITIHSFGFPKTF